MTFPIAATSIRWLVITLAVSGSVAQAGPGTPSRGERANFVDEHIFGKMERDGVRPAPVASDAEFLRRVTLDLTGRLPEVDAARKFLADDDPDKRDKLIDSLFPALPTQGFGRRPSRIGPFLDRWTTFFNDLFRNNEQLREGINSFHNYTYRVLEMNVPYDKFVRRLITAEALSTWTTGRANFVARHRVMGGDGYSTVNHEDTCDELALWTTRLFLGVDMECVSCHDGAGHLEKVNLWLSQRDRAEVWRQAAFFRRTFVAPVYGRIPEFQVEDRDSEYDLTTKSIVRLPRYETDITPTFVLSGEPYDEGKHESERAAYARMLTEHPQFARATANLFWAELMGRGIVDPPFGFDLARQDPANPPPAPWTVQPSHPELLDALAEDFKKSGFDLRHLMKTIIKSNAYQLSSYVPGDYDPAHDEYFARHQVRRLSAEEFWDAVQQSTGIFEEFTVRADDDKFSFVMQARFNQDFASSHKDIWNLLQDWGQTDREDPPHKRPSMVQAASVLNHELIRERVEIREGSRLDKLLRSDQAKSNEEVVEELFLATISRMPTEAERSQSVALLASHRDQGAEDLLWALLNRLDFVLVQ
jgi:hypothetical protein